MVQGFEISFDKGKNATGWTNLTSEEGESERDTVNVQVRGEQGQGTNQRREEPIPLSALRRSTKS